MRGERRRGEEGKKEERGEGRGERGEGKSRRWGEGEREIERERTKSALN